MANPHSEPLFDLLSYARRGPGRRDHVAAGDIMHIARTVTRTAEVMVKVLSQGANDLTSVRKHLEYIGRKGKVDLETDSGEKLQGAKDLLEDWDLELNEYAAGSEFSATHRKQLPRLVHKVMFSMPAGTPPAKVLTAVQTFCREEFALKHRYVMALHTDEPHPHVHVVIKAISEQGQRLNIRKATLRQWRADFARHLRAIGVPANATDRYIRGEATPRKSDGIYRASLRGQSTHMRNRAEAVAQSLTQGGSVLSDSGNVKVMKTREEVNNAWHRVSEALRRVGKIELSRQVMSFVARMPPPLTEREWIAARILGRPLEREVRKEPTR